MLEVWDCWGLCSMLERALTVPTLEFCGSIASSRLSKPKICSTSDRLVAVEDRVYQPPQASAARFACWCGFAPSHQRRSHGSDQLQHRRPNSSSDGTLFSFVHKLRHRLIRDLRHQRGLAADGFARHKVATPSRRRSQRRAHVAVRATGSDVRPASWCDNAARASLVRYMRRRQSRGSGRGADGPSHDGVMLLASC